MTAREHSGVTASARARSWMVRLGVQHGLPLAGYLLLSVALTFPLVTTFQDAIVGGPIARADGWQNVWVGWWVAYALRNGHNPFVTSMLYAPNGISLLLQTLNITNWIMTLPVQLTLGPLAAYNAAALLGFTLSGYTAYVFVQRVIHYRPAAVLAGACFTAVPFHVAKFYDGQLEHVALQWLPLYALTLLLVSERFSWRSLGLCALALALVSYTSWYYTIFCAAYTFVYLLWVALGERQPRRALIVGAALGCCGLAIILPALLVTLQTSDARPVAHWVAQAQQSGADLTELFLPSALHPWWGAPIEALQEAYHPNNSGWLVTPGYTVLLLAIYGSVRAWQVARRWVLLGVTMAIFALGSSLHIGGYDTGMPLPYRLLELVPGANLGRRPSHFVAVALLPLIVLVGLGLRDCLQRFGRRGVLLVAALMLVVTLEDWPRAKEVTTLDVPPAYAALRGEPGSVLDVPANAGGLDDLSSTLKHQLIHERPILGGYVSRRPDYWLSAAPGVQPLWQLRCDASTVTDAHAALGALAFYGVRSIVLNLPDLRADQQACARTVLTKWGLTPQIGSDVQTLIYQVPVVDAASFAYLYNGWYLAEGDSGGLWRWMGQHSSLVIVNTTGRPAPLVLELTLESYRTVRRVSVQAGERTLAQLDITPGMARVYRVPLASVAGEQLLSLSTVAEADPAPDVDRQISIKLSDARVLALSGATASVLHQAAQTP